MKGNKASSTADAVLQGLMFIGSTPEYQHLVSSRNREIGLHLLNSSQGRSEKTQTIKQYYRKNIVAFDGKIAIAEN